MQLFETETGSLVNDEDVKKCQIVGQKEISFYLVIQNHLICKYKKFF